MKCVGLVGCFFVACAVAGCAAGADDSCTVQSDCVDGYVCYQGKCEKRGQLVVNTDSLPNAVVGVDYQVSMKASGGVEPYVWTLEDGPGWLSLNRDSGLLSGVAEEPASNVQVVVRVTDSSDGDGQVASVTLLLTVVECVDGTAQACFEVQGGKCLQGNETCAGGRWGECSGLTHSSRTDHCGPECGECDAEVSDGCYLGLCTCGDGTACAGGQLCCLQKCVDITQDDENCGACGLNCFDQVKGAKNPHCENGKCTYDQCDADTLDCDKDRSNGCETNRDMDNCSFCQRPCAGMVEHAIGLACKQNEANGQFFCSYDECESGYYDCDANESNGCETQASPENCGDCGANCIQNPLGPNCVFDDDMGLYRCGCTISSSCGNMAQCCDLKCVPENDPAHCGDCDTVCDDPTRPVCIDPYDHKCGCSTDEQCGAGSICCDEHCIAIDLDNCGQCGRVCDAKRDHGSRCDLETGTCYCEDDSDCILSGFANSHMTCRSSVCVCEWSDDITDPVDPTYPDENIPCCGRVWVYDVMSNPLACGQCGVQCSTGTCVNGGCGCSSDGDCYKFSSATKCDTNKGKCVCQDNPDGVFPCQDGRFCCAGGKGGNGGPDGGDDLGCCWYRCGENEPGDCLY